MSHTVQDMMRHRNSGATRGPAHAVNDGTGNQGSGTSESIRSEPFGEFERHGILQWTELRYNRINQCARSSVVYALTD